jgi:hypothetical protein
VRSERGIMNALIMCNECGAKVWTHGEEEDDINAFILDENDPLEDGCEHMKNGHEVTVIETNYDDSDNRF